MCLLLGVLLSSIQGQDLNRFQRRMEQLVAQQEIRKEFSQDFVEIAQEIVDSLTKLWTEPGYVESLIDTEDDIPWNCLSAAWNLTHYTDEYGLPVAIDVLDAFGKIGPGKLPETCFFSCLSTLI